MVEQNIDAALKEFKDCIPIFEVLADQNRQNIIMILAKEKQGLNVNLITEKMTLSRPAISHHLKVLKQANVIDVRKEGTENIYYLTFKDTIVRLKHFVNFIENSCSSK